MRKNNHLTVMLLLLGCTLLFWSCSTEQTSDPLSALNYKISDMSSLSTAANVERQTFYPRETILLSMEKLVAQCQTRIEIIRVADDEVIRTLLVLADENGKIVNLPVWYNIGVDAQGDVQNVTGQYYIHILQLNIRGLHNNLKIPFSVAPAPAPFAMIWPAKSDGKFQGGSVLLGGSLYAAGSGFAANATVHLYVCAKKAVHAVGDVLTDVSGDAEVVTADAAGAIAAVEIWAAASAPGTYDLIADSEPFGQYSAGDVIFNPLLSSLNVVEPPAYTDLIQDIACDAAGVFRDQFSATEAIYGQVIPGRLPAHLQEHVGIYVMPHRTVWKSGDQLVNILTVGSLSSPIYCLMDPTSGAVQVLELRGATKSTDPVPVRLWPCFFDVIVDVNLNRVYDPGIDILDGGTRPGFQIGDGSCSGNPVVIHGHFGEYWNCGVGKQLLRLQVLGADGTPLPNVRVAWKLDKGTGTIDPLWDFTDENGIAESWFWGATMGDWSQVRGYAFVNNVGYQMRIYLWGNLCYTHNQGIMMGY